MTITHCFIYAAGYGKRLMPYTKECPKPLLPIQGKPLLEWLMEAVTETFPTIKNFVVNAHYHHDQIQDFCKTSSYNIKCRVEPTLLGTGGGMVNALPLVPIDRPLLILNGDAIWPKSQPLLTMLREAWNPEIMDVILALIPKSSAYFYEGSGDYVIQKDKRLCFIERCKPHDALSAGVFSGARILHPSLLGAYAPQPFPIRMLFDAAEHHKRLYGVSCPVSWYHIGTPQAYEAIQRIPLNA